MKKFFLPISLILIVFVLVFVFLRLGPLADNAPEGWKTFRSQEMGFSSEHPDFMELQLSPDEAQQRRVAFFFGDFAQEEDMPDLLDGIEFSVRKLPLGNEDLFGLARARSAVTEPISIGGLQGYQYQPYQEDAVEGGYPANRRVVLLPAGEGEFFEISYNIEDPTNQGYQQIVDQMLVSFATYEPIPWGLILLVGVLVFVLVAGSLLLFISRP